MGPLFERCLRQCCNKELWRLYLRYVKQGAAAGQNVRAPNPNHPKLQPQITQTKTNQKQWSLVNSKSLIAHSLPVWARTYLTVPAVQARDELKTAYAFVATHYGMDIGTPFAHLNAQDERNDFVFVSFAVK